MIARLLLLAALLLVSACAKRQPVVEPGPVRFPDIARGPDEATLMHIASGGAVIAFLPLPEAATIGGPLIDPAGVRATFNGVPADVYIIYRLPQLPGVAILPRPESLGDTTGTLEVKAAILGRPGIAFQGGVDIPNPEGIRPLWSRFEGHIVAADGTPITGAFVYGQHLKALFRRTTDLGRVYFDAIVRGRIEPHQAWAVGHWASPFDPREVSGTALLPIGSDAARAIEASGGIALTPLAPSDDSSEGVPVREVDVRVALATGGAPREAVAFVANRYWRVVRKGRLGGALLPREGGDQLIWIIAAGCLPERIEVPPDVDRLDVVLRPLPATP